MHQLDALAELRLFSQLPARVREHLLALVEPNDGASVAPDELSRDEAGAGSDVEDAIGW